MRAFTYHRAHDVAGALGQYGPGTMYLGGGTNLVGAAVRNADLAAHPVVASRYPMLAQAVLAGASGQVRSMATVGGNLLQRTRCTYFQDVTMPCNKRDPGSGCPAIDGDHSNLAILGHSARCVATHPSDMAVALTALDARVHVTSTSGSRVIGMPGLHRLPADDPSRDTVLEPGELITAVSLPPPLPGRSRYRKVRERASFAFALGGVAHVPWRAFMTERAVADVLANRDSFAAAADAELRAAAPLTRNVYKVALTRNLIIETLEELVS